MELLNRLVARYGSADGTVVNRRRVAVALPSQNAGSARLRFWLFRADGTPLSGVPNIRLVLISSAGERIESHFGLVSNRVDIGFSAADALLPGIYEGWFEVSLADAGYLRTDSFELHFLP